MKLIATKIISNEEQIKNSNKNFNKKIKLLKILMNLFRIFFQIQMAII